MSSVGPWLGDVARPVACPACDARWIWFDGWRLVHAVVLVGGQPQRFDDGLWLRRAECSACRVSRTLWPPFVYPHRRYEPDVVEAAVFAYLSAPSATYRSVAKTVGCAPSTVWLWVAAVARLGETAAIVAEAMRHSAVAPIAPLVPRVVPATHRKAESASRYDVLLRAFQFLTALALLGRAMPHPPDDPSPLRGWLVERFRRLGVIDGISPRPSPASKHPIRGPPR